MMNEVSLVAAREEDVPAILRLITALGEYEKLSHEVVATEAEIRDALFGPHPAAEVVIAWVAPRNSPALAAPGQALPSGEALSPVAIGFALFFHNVSTFLGRRGLYLEDLFVVPEWRGRGVGRQLLQHLARIAVERRCGRMEWAVLDWNTPSIRFYRRLGAGFRKEWILTRLTGAPLRRLAR